MELIKKEILYFSAKEIDALRLVAEICTELKREAIDPELKRAAELIYNCIEAFGRWKE